MKKDELIQQFKLPWYPVPTYLSSIEGEILDNQGESVAQTEYLSEAELICECVNRQFDLNRNKLEDNNE